MTPVLLLHAGTIPHYRIPIYGYLGRYLGRYGIDLIVASDGIQQENPHAIEFQHEAMRLSVLSIARLVRRLQIKVIIDYMELKHWYLFPTYLVAKGMLGRKMIYWGQGLDLLDASAKIKNLAYAAEQSLCDAIILYAEHLKKYVPKRFHKKVFVANNTLCVNYAGLPAGVTRQDVLSEYGIRTTKNIICMGRMQKRKRVDRLVQALQHMQRTDVGLILVGPDPDGILDGINNDRIYKLGPLYGNKKFDLLSSADVYCLPGAVGLSVIDAFHCGLPFVTEAGDESAEIMYVRHGENGFVVPQGDIPELARKLELLLDNDVLRQRFSDAAKKEAAENGNIDRMCAGFRDAILSTTDRAA